MGVLKVTAYPSRYAAEPEWYDEPRVIPEWQALLEKTMTGTFTVQFDAVKKRCRSQVAPFAHEQRDLARCIGSAIGRRAIYDRRACWYDLDGWLVSGYTVTSEKFGAEDMKELECVFRRLVKEDYRPIDWVTIYYCPERYDKRLILNLCNIIQSRSTLIVKALSLNEDIQIIVDRDPAFGISLNAFSFEAVEACVFLLRQAIRMAINTNKARMQPCDMSNPKYQMRSWLLRLGFVGEAFARPRKTLLKHLDGDVAFYSDESKQKAEIKRKAQRLSV